MNMCEGAKKEKISLRLRMNFMRTETALPMYATSPLSLSEFLQISP